MKRFFNTVIATVLLTSTMAQADCLPFYKERIQSIDAKMTGYKNTMITTGVSEAALIGGLAIATGTVAAGAVMVMPATIVGAGTYFGILAAQKAKYKKAYELIRESKQGLMRKTSKKTLRKLNKKLGTDVDQTTLLAYVAEKNANFEFCELNEVTEKRKLMSYAKIMKQIREEARSGLL